MKKFFQKHQICWANREILHSSLVAFLFFAFSLLINNVASVYATGRASSAVQDIFLSNVPVFNVSFIVNEGALLFTFFVALVLFWEPQKIPFTLKAIALFILTRSVFITLTHLGPFPERSFMDPTDMFRIFNSGGDFFFSGHTGLPFLIAIIFWHDKLVRNVSLIVSVIFGLSVLFGHLHYSIDVISAFFITYTIYHLAERFFTKELALFRA